MKCWRNIKWMQLWTDPCWPLDWYKIADGEIVVLTKFGHKWDLEYFPCLVNMVETRCKKDNQLVLECSGGVDNYKRSCNNSLSFWTPNFVFPNIFVACSLTALCHFFIIYDLIHSKTYYSNRSTFFSFWMNLKINACSTLHKCANQCSYIHFWAFSFIIIVGLP